MTSRAQFKQADITRAVNALKAAGLTIARLEIETNGKITIIPEPNGPGYASRRDDDAWKEAREKFSAAHLARQAKRRRSKE